MVIAPTVLTVKLPKGSHGITVDGKAIDIPAGTSKVAVLPLEHKVTFKGTQILQSEIHAVDAFGSLAQTIAFRPTATPAGMAKVATAVRAAFDACAKQTSLAPEGCPQHIDEFSGGSGQWKVVGDPTQDLVLSFDEDLNAIATGHFQMIAAYHKASVPGTQHSLSSGGYGAELSLAADQVTVSRIRSVTGLPALQRPAGATDQAAKDLVLKGLNACATTRLPVAADCPQQIIGVDVRNVRWTIHGNPVASASVNFDPETGLITVHGDLGMSARYDYIGGLGRTGDSFTSAYTAYLLWDGQALRLVTIGGEFS